MAETKMYGVRFLPALMIIALVCVATAAGLLAFGGQDMDSGMSSVRSLNELLALSQKIPAQANAAVNGDVAALEKLSQSRARYSELAQSLGGDVQSFDGSTEILKQSQVDPQLAARRSKACTRPQPTCARWCRSCCRALATSRAHSARPASTA